MTIPYQCTPDDYKEASAANGVWAKLEARLDRIPALIVQVGAIIFVLEMLLIVLTEETSAQSRRIWRVAPKTLILANVAVPSFLVVLSLGLLAKYWRNQPRLSGVVQREVPKSLPGMSAAKAIRGVAGWVIFFALAAVLFVMQKISRRVATTPTGTPLVATPRGETGDLPAFALLALAVFPVVLCTILLAALQRKLQYKTYLRGQPQLFEPRTFSFDDQSIVFDSGVSYTRVRWPAILKFLESENLFLLYTSDIFFYMVPKRVLLAAGQLENFVATLTHRVSVGVLLPRPGGGFPVQPIPAIPITPPPLPPTSPP